MKISICHKNGVYTNIECKQICHIEVDGRIIWYPDFRNKHKKRKEGVKR